LAFKAILEWPTNGAKKLLIIDEFPYMCKGNSSIPSILQILWDEQLKNQNVMIVLCGSAMSFIEKEILSEKNPLYGRTTGIYRLILLLLTLNQRIFAVGYYGVTDTGERTFRNDSKYAGRIFAVGYYGVTDTGERTFRNDSKYAGKDG